MSYLPDEKKEQKREMKSNEGHCSIGNRHRQLFYSFFSILVENVVQMTGSENFHS